MSHIESLSRIAGRLTLAGLLLAFAPHLAGCTPQVTVLSSRTPDSDFHTITVIGQGEASAKPDIAHASLGVEVIAPTVADASAQAAARMTQILTALKRAGVAEADIRTSNFSVNRDQQPDYGMPTQMPGMPMGMPMPGGPAPELAAPVAPPPAPPVGRFPKGMPAPPPPAVAPAPPPAPMPYMPPRMTEVYRVSNTVDVKIRDLTKVGPILDAAMAAGANNIWGVHFTLEDHDPLQAKAREKAAADARAKAEALARLQGVTLAGVVSINEAMQGSMPPPMPMMAPMMAMREGGPGTPTAPGEVSLTAQVQVVYALKGEGAAQLAETR
ncbi:MAG: SIMPL domain-containing protein [Polyangiaceae bacterium]|nr:SIMPL domain-containing protein [Polyangiaceae bacterium]